MVPQLELPQGGEWIVILIIVVLLFGAKKLPELSRNAARALNEFNKARAEEDDKPAQVAAPETAQPPADGQATGGQPSAGPGDTRATDG